MARIVWLMDDKKLRKHIALLPGVSEAVDDVADEIGAKARARLAAHPGVPLPGGTTDNASRIEVRHSLPGRYGSIDADVSLLDPRAVAIEFGHMQKVWGRSTGKYTPGLYIVTGAADIKKAGWGKRG